MKQKSAGLCQTFIRMVDDHAKANDNMFVGQIILYSLGIDGFCMDFYKCKTEADKYGFTWSLGNGDWYNHTFTKSEIEAALMSSRFKLRIEVVKGESE